MRNLSFEIGVSRNLSVLLAFMHCGAVGCCLPLDLPWQLKVTLTLVALVSMLFFLNKHGIRRGSSAIVKCSYDHENNWRLETLNGQILQGKLVPNILRIRSLIILNFKVSTIKRLIPVIVFSDAIESKTFRRLQVYLLTNKNSILNS